MVAQLNKTFYGEHEHHFLFAHKTRCQKQQMLPTTLNGERHNSHLI